MCTNWRKTLLPSKSVSSITKDIRNGKLPKKIQKYFFSLKLNFWVLKMKLCAASYICDVFQTHFMLCCVRHQTLRSLTARTERKAIKPIVRGRDSSVGIATRYGRDGPGIESRWGVRFSAPVQTGPVAHPASYTMSTGSSPGVNGQGVA